MADLIVKQGDAGALLTATFTDAGGNAVNLTGASVTCVIRSSLATTPQTSLPATIVAPTAGTVSYPLTAADTAQSGLYVAEFRAALAAGGICSAPSDGWLEYNVEENLSTPGGARLVGLGEVKEYLNIASSDRTHDAELVRFADAMVPVVEKITGPVLQRTYQNEAYDGGGAVIMLRHYPVIQILSVIEYRGPVPYQLSEITSIDVGSIYSYMYEPPGAIVRRSVGGGMTTFPPGSGAVLVSYLAGFSKVPDNIRMAVLELVRVNYQRTQQMGRPLFGGSGSGDESDPSGPPLGFLVPGRVRELLAPNKRPPRIA